MQLIVDMKATIAVNESQKTERIIAEGGKIRR
jgi:hypothetical protein